jgi:hypothetical protein
VDSAPLFRATAAWVMGQTADPRFLPVLEKLARDLYASVRKNAAKSTGLIRQSMGAAADNLQLRVLRSEQGEYQSVWIQAIGPDGATIRGLLPSQFVVWNGQNLVTDYEVIEHNTPGNVVAGLAVCREGALPAVTAGLEEKTPEHLWAITQIVSGGGEAADMAPAVYLADPNKLKATVADPPSKVLAGVETLAAIKSLLPAIIKIPGTRHLILFPESGFDSPTEIEPHIASATKHKVAIHAIVAGSPGNSLKSICDRTGGILVAIGDDADLGAEFQQLYSALSNHYVIRYRGEPAEGGATTVLRVQVYSGQGQGECSTAVTAATLSSVSA